MHNLVLHQHNLCSTLWMNVYIARYRPGYSSSSPSGSPTCSPKDLTKEIEPPFHKQLLRIDDRWVWILSLKCWLMNITKFESTKRCQSLSQERNFPIWFLLMPTVVSFLRKLIDVEDDMAKVFWHTTAECTVSMAMLMMWDRGGTEVSRWRNHHGWWGQKHQAIGEQEYLWVGVKVKSKEVVVSSLWHPRYTVDFVLESPSSQRQNVEQHVTFIELDRLDSVSTEGLHMLASDRLDGIVMGSLREHWDLGRRKL